MKKNKHIYSPSHSAEQKLALVAILTAFFATLPFFLKVLIIPRFYNVLRILILASLLVLATLGLIRTLRSINQKNKQEGKAIKKISAFIAYLVALVFLVFAFSFSSKTGGMVQVNNENYYYEQVNVLGSYTEVYKQEGPFTMKKIGTIGNGKQKADKPQMVIEYINQLESNTN